MKQLSLEELNSLRNEGKDTCCLASKLMFHHIYGKQLPYQLLTPEERESIRNSVPRYQVEQFPENYPEDGYTGDYWTVYRGIFFPTKQSRDSFFDSLKDGRLQTATLTSWSIHPEIAEEFANGAGYLSYTDNKEVEGYGGVVLEISHLLKEQVFFSGYEAHNTFDDCLQDFPEWTTKNQTFEREEEFVLLPTELEVSIYKEIRSVANRLTV